MVNRVVKYLIAGLGNIGPEYTETRHNAGFRVLDRYAEIEGFQFYQRRYALKAETKFKGRHLHLIKPVTFMNLSGKAIRFWLDKLSLPVGQLLVITDDIALPFGKLRLKGSGGAGGHNGLINIEEQLMTNKYARLRIGIGNDYPKGRQIDYVLGNWEPEQLTKLPAICDKAIDVIKAFISIGLERTMNRYN